MHVNLMMMLPSPAPSQVEIILGHAPADLRLGWERRAAAIAYCGEAVSFVVTLPLPPNNLNYTQPSIQSKGKPGAPRGTR